VDKTGTITGTEMHVTSVRPMMKGINPEGLHALLSDLAASQSRDNITMAALQDYFDRPKGREALSVCPFSSRYKYCGVAYKEGNFVLGAPEYVLTKKV
jgi:cation-transporting ATPase E